MKLLNVSNKSLIDRHPFNGLFARTTGVSRSPERLNYLDFNEARNDGVRVASAGPCANHLCLAPDR